MGYLSKLKNIFVNEDQADKMRLENMGSPFKVVCCRGKEGALRPETLQNVRKERADVFVIPEVPENMLSRSASWDETFEFAEEVSKKAGCAVVFKKITNLDLSYGEGAFESGIVYKNAYAKKEDAEEVLYLKHTETKVSPFDFEAFEEEALDGFPLIDCKDHVLGLMPGSDFRHAMFSRMYHGFADMVITLPDADMNERERYTFGRARAIENYCYNFVLSDKPLAFNPNGKSLKGDVRGNLIVFDTGKDEGGFEEAAFDVCGSKAEGEEVLKVPEGNVEALLKQSEQISSNLYVYPYKEMHIVMTTVRDEDIYFPETALENMYSDVLKGYENKRYILINRFKELEEADYRNLALSVLCVRSLENRCIVLLESDQRIVSIERGCVVEGTLTWNLSEAKGPESIWGNSTRRKGYEKLIELADAHEHHDHHEQ